jgi:hypothetical protein
MGYCNHCGHHAELPDGAFCAWCVRFFYDNGRMPEPDDYPPQTAIERAYAAMGWDITCLANAIQGMTSTHSARSPFPSPT